MSWQIDNGPTIVEEHHFDDRVVKCFAERPRTISQLLSDTVKENSDGDAIVDGDTRLSYQDLEDSVDCIAGHLVALGVEKGDRIAIIVKNSAAFIQAIMATARLGAISVPINIRSQTPELAYILNHASPKVLVHDADLKDRLPDVGVIQHQFSVGEPSPGMSRFEDLLAKPSKKILPAPRASEEDVAIILYTSGTTGQPKGAMLTHFNIAHSVMHFELCMTLRSGERSIIAVPASHITGLIANILTMIRVAGCSIILPEFDARTFLDLAAKERMTHTLMVPAMYNLCLLRADLDDYDLSAWRIGGYGGAPMPEATISALADQLPNLDLMNAYGSTETCSPTTIMPEGETASRPDSVGRVVPCGDLKIVDEAGLEVETGMSGEIWVAGPMVIPGYWNDPEKTAAGFSKGYWKSGDIGSIDADGFIRIHDRIKDMIIRGGYNVYSAELENTLSHHPEIVECAAVAQSDDVLGEKIHMFVRAKTERLTADDVRQFCKDRLADYKVPDFVTFLEVPLPRNANGKILKTALREQAGKAFQGVS